MSAAKVTQPGTPLKRSIPEIPMDNKSEVTSNKVCDVSCVSKTERPPKTDEGRVSGSSLESLQNVRNICGSGSLNSAEMELLKMAQEEHKTKMEVLNLKRQYLELKIGHLEEKKGSSQEVSE